MLCTYLSPSPCPLIKPFALAEDTEIFPSHGLHLIHHLLHIWTKSLFAQAIWIPSYYQPVFPVGLLLLLSCFSRVRLCATSYTTAHQSPLSLGFSRQEYWSGLPFPSPIPNKVNWLIPEEKKAQRWGGNEVPGCTHWSNLPYHIEPFSSQMLVPCSSCQVLGQPLPLKGILEIRSSGQVVLAATRLLAGFTKICYQA